MPITIGSNINSLVAQRRLSQGTAALSNTFERLSSGLRINRASDDAAGLAISSTLNSSSRVFAQGVRNVNDAISYLNIAEGALGELASLTTRQMELAEQAANGVYSSKQRNALNAEADSLTYEFNRIIEAATFNGRKVLDVTSGSRELRIQAGYGIDGGLAVGVGTELQRAVGDGTFLARQSYEVNDSETVESIVLGDLNGDGKFDIVSGIYSAGGMAIQIGNGNGTFQSAVSYSTGASRTEDVILGDLNEDGKLDIVTADRNTDRVSIYFGVGNGTFSAGVSFTVGDVPTSVILGDFNGDSNLDIVTDDASLAGFSMLFGNGNGTFNARVSYSMPNGPKDVASGDFNGDSKLDLATPLFGHDHTFILFGNGNGTFRIAVSLPSIDPTTVTLGDVNGDGKLDIAVGSYGGLSVDVFLGNGDGTFSPRGSFAADGRVVDVKLGDLNGDGRVDIATANYLEGTASILIGNGDGTFSAGTSFHIGGSPASIALRDLNGDDRLDLVCAPYTNKVHVLLGNGDSTTSIAHFSLKTAEYARDALSSLNEQLARVSAELGLIGSHQSRLEVTLRNLGSSKENYLAAASRIEDADIASESAALTRQRILQQVASAVLAQANQQPGLAISLLRP